MACYRLILSLCVVWLVIMAEGRKNPRNRKRAEECAIFKADALYAMNDRETFINIGAHYSIESNLDIRFDVFPDRLSHDGVLLSTGTENFEYYEWKTKAVKTQFFVLEFYFSALSMLMKALGTNYMNTLEIFRTYPDTYFLGDADWHKIRVVRNNQTWTLYLDTIVRTQDVTLDNNVQIREEQVYIGGKPGQYHYQFRGIIKNLHINGARVMMKGQANQGLVEVVPCSDQKVLEFMEEIRTQEEPSRDLP